MPKHTRWQDIDPLAIATRGSTLTRIVLFSACFLLAACGGGSTSDTTVANYSVLKRFSDEGGVGRGVSNSDGSQLVFIMPFITEVVAELNMDYVLDLEQIRDVPIIRTTATANIRQGPTIINRGDETTIDLLFTNVQVVEDNGGQAFFSSVALDLNNQILAGGTAYGSAPAGEFTYQGTQGVGRRVLTTTPELGTFSLTANFDEQTFSYDGSSANSAVSGSGIIDTVNGRFATSTLDVTANGADYTGTMHGLLHGSSSQSVSGVFHTNEDNPTYAGAFVGSR